MSNAEQNKSSSRAVDDTDNQTTDSTWPFIVGELEELFESNKPLPGDILLLNSDGIKGKLSRIFQGFGNFSHVGIVVGSDLYIDAVSRDGVRIRFIEDIIKPEAGYALDKCFVARNQDLVMNQDSVLTSALDYFARPYKLRSVFMRRNQEIEEKDPVICSKLVAMIFDDIGRSLGLKARKTFPKHFDALSKLPKWRRFPLSQYDLIRDPTVNTTERRMSSDSWFKSVEHLCRSRTNLRSILRRGRKKNQ